MRPLEDELAAAAFHGSPRAALPLLGPLDPAGRHPDRVRWLAGICLGALGRYDAAARWLLPPASTPPSSALSCRASHLRQLGRHAEAEPLDTAALATAADWEARLDALVGLVADAVGRLDLGTARSRLERAAAGTELAGHPGPGGGDSAWRPRVRLDWVRAEVALLGDDPSGAAAAARDALRRSLAVAAYRHAVKSRLVVGAALEAAGHPRRAARVLRRAAAGADRLDLPTLAWPARTLLARVLDDRAPAAAARERQRARSARGSTDTAADRRTSR